MRIPCIVVVWLDYPNIKRSVDYISSFADRLDIHVIENPSERSEEIGAYLLNQLRSGAINHYFRFHENISNNAVDKIVSTLDFSQSPYLLLTDGDVVASGDWLSEELEIIDSNPDVFCVTTDLSLDNLPVKTFPDAQSWVPPAIAVHDNYIEGYGGHHLLLMRSHELLGLNEYRKLRGWSWTDGSIRQYAYANGRKWAKTKKSKAVHLTWDNYANTEHPYTKARLAHSIAHTWDHSRTSDYDHFTREWVKRSCLNFPKT